MIEIRDIAKAYRTGDFIQRALDGVSITFRDNEFVAILGPSGSGKTTLLNVLGGLDHADSGDLVINGTSTANYRDKDWDTYRNHRIGFIFQSYNLIPHQTILSNVELALTLAGIGPTERRERAREALARVGLADHVDKLPSQLSGGQMQRVAIARALVNDPDIVLADEPTGALDTETGVQVMDLLKEIADERLVVMVTHNPELAERYATRIVRLADGRITDDSDPYVPTPEEVSAAVAEGPLRRAGMSFLTALSLSFNNLMTKKGRTFLTAFAGSIGIIGIAAILALSNGVNDYIAKTEEDAMSAFPLSISEAAPNIAAFMIQPDATEEEVQEYLEPWITDPSRTPELTDLIPETTIVQDMFARIDSNDLTSFREYLESDESGIAPHVNDIVYNYNVTPRFYRAGDEEGVVELGTALSSGQAGSLMSAFSSLGLSGGSTTSSFQEMINNRDLLQEQYDVIAGRWPEAYDECVIVTSSRGRLTDYTLYNLGVLDPNEFQRIVESVSTDEEVEVPDNDAKLTYGDALSMTFKVVSPASCYKLSDTGDSWTDMSGDEAFMRAVFENEAIDLRVVGVIRANEDNDNPLLSEGVAYTHDLTLELIARAGETDVVKAQIADPDRDVFTGETFEDLRNGTADAFDMGELFSVDQSALERAFAFDSSALEGLGGGMDLSGISIDPSAMSFDPSKIQIDPNAASSAFDSNTMAAIMAGIPAPDPSSMAISMNAAQMGAISQASAQISAGFFPWLGATHPDVVIDESTDLSPYIQEYLATDEAQAILAQTNEALGPEFEGQVNAAVEGYLTNQVAPYLQQAMGDMAAKATEAMAAQLAASLQQQMAAATQSLATQLSEQIGGALTSQMSQLQSALEGAFSVDADAFASAIQFNMDADDLSSLMTNYAQAAQLTYDNNLQRLGWADTARPRSIDIYPVSFDDKEAVLGIIDEYNAKMEAAGKEEQKITYNDIMGALLSSVSDIVNTISTVLIAFVSISLVVSSIMIGIITYISVLERKKEIGILRAMGASKGNVANVFNAETFIEGLIAGVFAIAVVLAASVPVNAHILATRGVPNIMQLPARDAITLILISVVLTVLAGLLPSSAASRRDPVEALRSE